MNCIWYRESKWKLAKLKVERKEKVNLRSKGCDMQSTLTCSMIYRNYLFFFRNRTWNRSSQIRTIFQKSHVNLLCNYLQTNWLWDIFMNYIKAEKLSSISYFLDCKLWPSFGFSCFVAQDAINSHSSVLQINFRIQIFALRSRSTFPCFSVVDGNKCTPSSFQCKSIASNERLCYYRFYTYS